MLEKDDSELQNDLIDQVVFCPDKKFSNHLIRNFIIILILVDLSLVVTKPSYVTDPKLRHAFIKMLAIISPLLIGEVALINFFAAKHMKSKHRQITSWIRANLKSQVQSLEKVEVKAVSRLNYFLCGRSIRRAVRFDLRHVRVECCVRTHETFTGLLLVLPRNVRGHFFYPKYVALPLDLFSNAHHEKRPQIEKAPQPQSF